MASQMASTTGAGAWRGDVALLAKVAALGLLAVITIVTASFWSMPPELWQNATLPTSITKLQQLGASSRPTATLYVARGELPCARAKPRARPCARARLGGGARLRLLRSLRD